MYFNILLVTFTQNPEKFSRLSLHLHDHNFQWLHSVLLAVFVVFVLTLIINATMKLFFRGRNNKFLSHI